MAAVHRKSRPGSPKKKAAPRPPPPPVTQLHFQMLSGLKSFGTGLMSSIFCLNTNFIKIDTTNGLRPNFPAVFYLQPIFGGRGTVLQGVDHDKTQTAGELTPIAPRVWLREGPKQQATRQVGVELMENPWYCGAQMTIYMILKHEKMTGSAPNRHLIFAVATVRARHPSLDESCPGDAKAKAKQEAEKSGVNAAWRCGQVSGKLHLDYIWIIFHWLYYCITQGGMSNTTNQNRRCFTKPNTWYLVGWYTLVSRFNRLPMIWPWVEVNWLDSEALSLTLSLVAEHNGCQHVRAQ